MKQLLLLALLTAPAFAASSWQDCRSQRLHGRDATSCFEALERSADAATRAEGFWGLDQWDQANNEFRQAIAKDPNDPAARVRWGLLLHERFNNSEAVDLFHEALAKKSDYAPAYYGLALVSADGFDGHAPEYLAKALTLDPKSAETHVLAAEMALENSDPKAATEQADAALALAPDALDAMAIHAAVELLADRSADTWLHGIEAVNPHYGEAWARIAYELVQNRRYEDGVRFYRTAVERDPSLWPAHSQLGVNLMRLGKEQEPEHELQLAYDHGYRDAATVNSLRLLASYKNFVTVRDQTTILRLNRKEADLLQPYFEEQLHKAMATYNVKYKMASPGPVQVEVYPDHEDFAVRTSGLPGLGALGVTFDQVVAMDSPSARKPGEFEWAATLWHEMSHVYVLTATNYRVPRWFTEGLAVHEETQASPEWGDRVTPEILAAIRDKKLLPIDKLDRGFIYPEYPAQVIVSYFEAGSMCDFIGQRWGESKLLDLVHAFATLTPTSQVIEQVLGEAPAEFDKQYAAWLDHQLGPVVANLDLWRKTMGQLADAVKAKDNAAILEEAKAVRDLYPQYVYDANAYGFLAQAQLATGDKPGAIKTLTTYETKGGHDPATLKQLAALEEEAGDPAGAAATLDRVNVVFPTADEDLHRHLGRLWLAQKNLPGAIREFNAVLACHPLDQAQAQFDLASAYMASGDKSKAEEADLLALEAAPGFRPAQKLLLELHPDSPQRPSQP